MSKILSRFRRSPSRSSTTSQDDEKHFREASASSQLSTEGSSPLSHTRRNPSGSVFVEDIPGTESSRRTPNAPKSLAAPLTIPTSGSKPLVGTPKLVLTEEGSSPRSFLSYSPQLASPSKKGLGLGLESVSHLVVSLIIVYNRRSDYGRGSADGSTSFPIK
jgi:hypothetical protein